MPTGRNSTSAHDGFVTVAAAVVGRKHVRTGTPCQDAATAKTTPRPFLLVADGRGSSECSHFGARTACETAEEVLTWAEEIIAASLDHDEDDGRWPMIARALVNAIAIRHLAAARRLGVSPAGMEHTLLLFVHGRKRCAYIHVGDGVMVARRRGRLEVISRPERGEYANCTSFVGQGTNARQLRAGTVETAGLDAALAMSDGAAERLYDQRNDVPGPGIGQIFDQVAGRELGRRELMLFLTEPFWEPMVTDDRAIAAITWNTDGILDTSRDDLPAATPPAADTNEDRTRPGPDRETAGTAAAPRSRPRISCLLTALTAFVVGLCLGLLIAQNGRGASKHNLRITGPQRSGTVHLVIPHPGRKR